MTHSIKCWACDDRHATVSEVRDCHNSEEANSVQVCECELDWNCGLHHNRIYTAIERINDRYASG